MAYNKVIYGGNTLIDLTEDTITPDKLLYGYTAHDKAGNPIVGTASGEVGQVITLDELEENYDNEGGFLLSYDSETEGRLYIVSSIISGKGALVETSLYDGASRWYLEQVSGYTDRFYLYSKVNGEVNYIFHDSATSANFIGLSTTTKTAFIVSSPADYKFYFKLSTGNRWLQHSKSGGGLRLYTDNNNAYNSQLTFTYQQNSIVPYGTLTITENGTYDVYNYKTVIVNIG